MRCDSQAGLFLSKEQSPTGCGLFTRNELSPTDSYALLPLWDPQNRAPKVRSCEKMAEAVLCVGAETGQRMGEGGGLTKVQR